MTTSARPIPVSDERSAPFVAAAKEGQLLIKRCPACDRHLAPQRDTCDLCASEALEWVFAAGGGTIYSYVYMHQVLQPAFREEVPYDVIVVELDEGPRLTSNFVGPDEDIRVGMRVEAVFEQLSDEVAVPKFREVKT